MRRTVGPLVGADANIVKVYYVGECERMEQEQYTETTKKKGIAFKYTCQLADEL